MSAKTLFSELPEWELDVLLAEHARLSREAEKRAKAAEQRARQGF